MIETTLGSWTALFLLGALHGIMIAAVVYYRLGLRLLQRAWINLDVIWVVR
jgi:hypothetical protein